MNNNENNFCSRCGKRTTIDSIHTCSPEYQIELREKFEQGYVRYETIRKMNVQQFKELYKKSIKGEDDFDALVDKLTWDYMKWE